MAALSLTIAGAGAYFSVPASAETADQSFAKNAAAGGMAEVKLGELAETNGSSTAVKDFGKRMQTDHSKADDRLKGVASKDNITLPSEMSRADQATYDRLSKLSGPEFDKAYAQDMVRDHEKDIASFKKEADDGQNPDVKQFASQTLPTLQEHLKLARDMEKTTTAENR
jgi:putative membrane protein